jgi:hypothetical protein
MSFYIVYSYTPSFSSTAPKKYIMGIYKELNHAINRQYEVCGKNHVTGVNNSVHGNGKTTFINVIPEGSCNIELFTTSLCSMSQYF